MPWVYIPSVKYRIQHSFPASKNCHNNATPVDTTKRCLLYLVPRHSNNVPLSFLMVCVQKLQVLQIHSQLQKPVYTKLCWCKIINLKLLFVNRVILTASKTATVCFNKTENNRILNNKQ